MLIAKSKKVLISVCVLIVFVFLNLLILTEVENNSSLWMNIEALAQDGEGVNPDVKKCLDVGTMCIGENQDGEWGKYPGMAIEQ